MQKCRHPVCKSGAKSLYPIQQENINCTHTSNVCVYTSDDHAKYFAHKDNCIKPGTYVQLITHFRLILMHFSIVCLHFFLWVITLCVSCPEDESQDSTDHTGLLRRRSGCCICSPMCMHVWKESHRKLIPMHKNWKSLLGFAKHLPWWKQEHLPKLICLGLCTTESLTFKRKIICFFILNSCKSA